MAGYKLISDRRALRWLVAAAALLGTWSAGIGGQPQQSVDASALRLSQAIDGTTYRIPVEITHRLGGDTLFRVGPFDPDEPVIVTFERNPVRVARAAKR